MRIHCNNLHIAICRDGKGIDREPAFIDEETQMIRMFDSEPNLRAFVPLGGDNWGDREPAVLAVAQVSA